MKKFKKIISIFLLFFILLLEIPNLKSYAITDKTPPTLDASSINVSKTEVVSGDKIKISLKATDDLSGIDSIEVRYLKPITKLDVNIIFSYNSSKNIYEGYLDINKYTESGVWKINNIKLYDKSYNSMFIGNTKVDTYNYYYDTSLDLSRGDFTVSGTDSDIKPPTIDISTLKVDKKQATIGDKVRISLKATDDKSNIKLIELNYNKQMTAVVGSTSVPMNYNSSTDEYEGYIYIDKNSDSGVWQIYSISLYDSNYNYEVIRNNKVPQSYGKTMDLSSGNFTVSGTNIFVPKIDLSTLKTDKNDYTVGDKVRIAFKTLSDDYKIYYSTVVLRKPLSGKDEFVTMSYNNVTGVCEGYLNINKDTESGLWQIHYIDIGVNYGNLKYGSTRIYNKNLSSYLPIEDLNGASFTVSGADIDEQAPTIDLSTIKIDKTNVKIGDTLNISFKAEDDVTGISEAIISYMEPNTKNKKILDAKYNPQTDRYEASLKITSDFQIGVWRIELIWLVDNDYNNNKIFNNVLISGTPNDFESYENLTIGDFTLIGNLKPIITRLGGLDRYKTSIAISNKVTNKEKVNNVIVSTGLNFADSLSASALAGKTNAPIVLVRTNSANSQDALGFIKNNVNKSGTVYILGGTGVVSDEIVKTIKSYGFTNIKRLGGSDRFDTNIAINNNLSIAKGTPVIIANSKNYADALSISSISGINKYPIFLTYSGKITDKILNAIKSISPSKIYIVGGAGVVSTNIENTLKSITSNITRLGGIDRYETSMTIAKHFNLTTDSIVLACGTDFPDALSGTALAIQKNASIILVKNIANDINVQTNFINSKGFKDIYVLGGTGVISDSVINKFKN